MHSRMASTWKQILRTSYPDLGLYFIKYRLPKCIWAVTCDFQQCGICDQQSLRSACAYAQSDQSLCLSLEYTMIVMLLTEQLVDFLSLKGGCTCSSESTLVKMPHCWKSHVTANLFDLILYVQSTIFQLNRDGSSWVEPVLSKDKCVLLKDHNAVTPVRLEPTASRSRVKHSSTEPLRSLRWICTDHDETRWQLLWMAGKWFVRHFNHSSYDPFITVNSDCMENVNSYLRNQQI